MIQKNITRTFFILALASSPTIANAAVTSPTVADVATERLSEKDKSAFDVLAWTKELKKLNAEMLKPYALARKIKIASFLRADIILNRKEKEAIQIKVKAVEKLMEAVKVVQQSSQKILTLTQSLEQKNPAEKALLKELLAKQKKTNSSFKKKLSSLKREKDKLLEEIKALDQENTTKSTQRRNSLDDADKIKSTLNLHTPR
tara:strand:+ start:2875 stop:3480 length:606 start_codon:yes stop_codon:yes gene_type:complete